MNATEYDRVAHEQQQLIKGDFGLSAQWNMNTMTDSAIPPEAGAAISLMRRLVLEQQASNKNKY